MQGIRSAGPAGTVRPAAPAMQELSAVVPTEPVPALLSSSSLHGARRWRLGPLGLGLGLGLLALAAGCSPQPREEDPGGPPGERKPEVLEAVAGASLQRSAEQGRDHSFLLELPAGRAAVVAAEPRGTGLALQAREGAGSLAAVADPAAATPGVKRLRLARPHDAEGAGAYLVEVMFVGEAPPGAGFRLTLESLGPAEARDLRGAAADRLAASAEELRAEGTAEAVGRAVALDLEALTLAEELGDPRRQAEILDHLGWIHRKALQEPRQAAPYYERAAALFAAEGDAGRRASVLHNLGRVRFDLGQMEGAVEAWTEAQGAAAAAGDRLAQAAADNHLALAARYLGDVQQALAAYDRSLEALAPLGAARELGLVYNNRGRLYRVLGEPGQALADFERARQLAEESGSAATQAVVLTAIGQVLEEQGELDQAHEVLERALGLRRDAGGGKGEGATLLALGTVEEKLGRPAEAREAYGRALGLFRRAESPRDEASALEGLARLSAAGGELEAALPLFGQALEGYRRLQDPHGEIRCLTGLAAAEGAAGLPLLALPLLEEALALVEGLRRRAATALRAPFLARQLEPYDLYVDLLMELHRSTPGAGYDVRAFEAAERSRARVLLDLLAAPPAASEAGGGPAAERQELERRLDLLGHERSRLLDGEGAPAQLAAVEARLEETLRRYRALDAEGDAGLGEGASASPMARAAARPLTLAEVRRRVLDPETRLLQYHLGPRRSHLWVVSLEEVRSYELPSRSELEAAARRAHELLRQSRRREVRGPAESALGELAGLLLGPAGAGLKGRRLLVSAEGPLLYVPFAALPEPDPAGVGGTSPIAARHEVVAVPSASILAALRQARAGRTPAAGRVAVLADPVFDRLDPRLGAPAGVAEAGSGPAGGSGAGRRLPFAGREARAVLDLAGARGSFLALGFEATREAALGPALSRHRILHFATHGEIDGEHPELSRLVLSRLDRHGRERNGFLHAHEIRHLDLPVELVVLSACETALGRELRGEGLVGLTQAFFQAGASGVVVSLWRVDDRATAALMARFYAGLFEQGLAPAAALRRAQLELRRQPAWQAPYYWAGFVLQGEWRQVVAEGLPAKPSEGSEDLEGQTNTIETF